MQWRGRKVPALAHDGWETADLYHWMVDCFAEGQVIILMPDIGQQDGAVSPPAWLDVMRGCYYGLVHEHSYVRGSCYALLAKQAHDLYAARAKDN